MSYIAKLLSKNELPDGSLEVTVEYTDGVDSQIETFVPSDKQGYFYRTEERKRTLNTAKELKTEDNIGKEVTYTATDTRTQAQKDKDLWFSKYNELDTLEKIAAKNFLTGARLAALTNKINTVKTFLDTNIKVEYLDFI